MKERKYTDDGYLIVSETDQCPMWEKDTVPCRSGYTRTCFFCRYTDFRTPEFIRRAEEMPQGEKLYSLCRNDENCKQKLEKESNDET